MNIGGRVLGNAWTVCALRECWTRQCMCVHEAHRGARWAGRCSLAREHVSADHRGGPAPLRRPPRWSASTRFSGPYTFDNFKFPSARAVNGKYVYAGHNLLSINNNNYCSLQYLIFIFKFLVILFIIYILLF